MVSFPTDLFTTPQQLITCFFDLKVLEKRIKKRNVPLLFQLPNSSKEVRGEPGHSGLRDGEDDAEVMADVTEDVEGRVENLTQRSVMLAAFVFVATCFVLVLFLLLLLLLYVCLLFLFSGWA